MMAKTKKKPPAKRKPRQQALPGLEQPRNEKIEGLIEKWHDAKSDWSSAGRAFSTSAQLLEAAMTQAGIECYEYDGKLVKYKAGKRKLVEVPVDGVSEE
jgi:hypothetical protein